MMTTAMNNDMMVCYSYDALLKIKRELNNDSSVVSFRVLRENEWASEKFTVEVDRK